LKETVYSSKLYKSPAISLQKRIFANRQMRNSRSFHSSAKPRVKREINFINFYAAGFGGGMELNMNTAQIIITIALMSIGTMATRFIPFLCFPANKKTPKYIVYLISN